MVLYSWSSNVALRNVFFKRKQYYALRRAQSDHAGGALDGVHRTPNFLQDFRRLRRLAQRSQILGDESEMFLRLFLEDFQQFTVRGVVLL